MAEKITEMLNIDGLDWTVCYQSKVGPLEWIGPSTDDEIIRVSKEKGKPVVIVPLAFVSEHSETLVELDIEYKELAEEHGIEHYYRVPTLCSHPLYIEALQQMVTSAAATSDIRIPGVDGFCCSEEHRQCPCKMAAS